MFVGWAGSVLCALFVLFVWADYNFNIHRIKIQYCLFNSSRGDGTVVYRVGANNYLYLLFHLISVYLSHYKPTPMYFQNVARKKSTFSCAQFISVDLREISPAIVRFISIYRYIRQKKGSMVNCAHPLGQSPSEITKSLHPSNRTYKKFKIFF